MRVIQETPERLVSDGQVTSYGTFKVPFREVNLLETDLVVAGREAGTMMKDLRLKEWQHYGIVSEDYYFGFVIFDAKFMAQSFFYAFDRKSGEMFEHARTTLAGPVRVARETWHSECYFRHAGYMMEFENRLDSGYHRLRAKIKGTRKKPAVKFELRMIEDLTRLDPLVIVSPVSNNRPLYTHKAVAPVEGTVEIGDKVIELDSSRDVALIDEQKTFYPYKTFWRWATFGGYDASGRLIGMNVCHNFIADDSEYNENCTWVDGRITLLPAVRFEFDECDVTKEWRINSTDGKLYLKFGPQGERHGKVSLGVIMSDFHQPFGTFEGRMPAQAESVPVDGQFGLCEHHLARF